MPESDLTLRLKRAQKEMNKFDLDALCISPGPDLRYFIDYDAKALERITCLAMKSNSDPVLFVPRLEKLPAMQSGAGRLGVEIRTYGEFEDPYLLIAEYLGNAARVGVDDRMWAVKAKGIENSRDGSLVIPAGKFTYHLRSVKSPYEIEALKRVSRSIDLVHQEVPNLLQPGRSELEVARDIGNLILQNDHAKIDFIIVATGANSASPHHEPSDSIIKAGDVVVVDIGGTSHEGYCSDCTRTYAIADVDDSFISKYNHLQAAQQKAVLITKPGVLPSEIDNAARSYLDEFNLSQFFIHRTGHGIGVETHEEPYIGSSLHNPLVPHQAFSIEPGFYIEGEYGARIEDIVITTESGYESLNNNSRDLIII